MGQRWVCLRRQRIAGAVRDVGFEFDQKPHHRNLVAWERQGYIRKVEASTRQEIPSDLSKLRKAELIDIVDGLGFSLDDIEGTGSGGNVLASDLIAFLESKR